MCLYSCAKYGGGGDHVRDPSMLQPPLLVFIFQEAVRRSIRSPWQLIVTWAAEGNNCSSYLMCFSASSAFVPFDESKEGKNRGRVVGKCVYVCVVVWLCLCGSKQYVAVRGQKSQTRQCFLPCSRMFAKTSTLVQRCDFGNLQTHFANTYFDKTFSVFLYYVRKNTHWDPVLCGSTWITSRGQRAQNQNTLFHTQIVWYRHNEDPSLRLSTLNNAMMHRRVWRNQKRCDEKTEPRRSLVWRFYYVHNDDNHLPSPSEDLIFCLDVN